MGYQKFVAVGNVTSDVKVFKDTVAKFSLAVNGYKENVTFFRCVAFAKRLNPKGFELLSKVTKGTPLLVEGEFSEGEYDKDGEKIKTFELNVGQFQYVGAKRESSASPETATATASTKSAAPKTETKATAEEDSDIPF